MRLLLAVLLVPLLGCTGLASPSLGAPVVGSAASAPASASARSTPARSTVPTRPRHVFVINLENKGFQRTWGPGSAAPYLARTLRAKGMLLADYYGTAHHSLGNYLAQMSGQGPTAQVQADCKVFQPMAAQRVAAYQQRVGDGCVYDASTPTLMKQLDRRGLTWRGYLQGMERPCEHPRLGTVDTTQKARLGHQYAARHNPFVYFRSVIDRPAYCRNHVVPLSRLRTDLATVAGTRNLSYLTPDLCNDGHDSPCVDGRPGGLVQFDRWLRVWVPRILQSPAFRRDGLLVITADESDGPASDSSACCGEGPTPNVAQPGIDGPGGGRIGALLISPMVPAGTRNAVDYNHYGLLASIEQTFGLGRIGYARLPQVHPFGSDVYRR